MARTVQNNTKLMFTNVYHKFLVDNFGGLYLEGCRQLATVISWYQLGSKLQELYKRYADKYGTTSDAVERNIRTYMNHITKQYSKEQLEAMFEYKFNKTNKSSKILITEFIAVVKYYLDKAIEEQQ